MPDGELIAEGDRGAVSELRAVSQAVVELFSDTEQVGIRRFEEDSAAELVEHLTPAVLRLIERACVVLGDLLSRYESHDDEAQNEIFSELEVVPLRAAPRPPGAAIGDLAFVSISELRQHQHRLQGHRANQEAKELMSDCGSALRSIRKSLYALEPLLCEVAKTPRLLPPRLHTSLLVRRQYQKLWSFAATTGDVSPATVRAALRGAGTRIAMLTGNPIYNHLREDDRFRLRELQGRILEWLREGDDHLVATRLWQDFALFVEMLRQVNLREELIEHDREALRAADSVLRVRGQAAMSEALALLSPLRGLDDGLDALLARDAHADELARELARVRAQLQDPQSISTSTTVAL
jgi:hypothetical protein